MTQVEAARQMGIPLNRLNEIIKGKRGITADTAWKLAALFDTTPASWMMLQANHDLYRAKHLALRTRIAPAEKLPREKRAKTTARTRT